MTAPPGFLLFAAGLRGEVPWQLLAGAPPSPDEVTVGASTPVPDRMLVEFVCVMMRQPRWKVDLLIQRNAVIVTRNGSPVPVARGSTLQVGDRVRIVTPLPPALQSELQALADTNFHDYILIPPPSTQQDLYVSGYRNVIAHVGADIVMRRPRSIWLNPPTGTEAVLDSLEEFVGAIRKDDDATAPIRDVILVSHANSGGNLFVRLRGAEEIAVVTYERLKSALDQGFLRFPPGTFEPRPLEAGTRRRARIQIRGCQIGRAVPFLTRLKQAFGGEVDVVAPRHFDRAALPLGGSEPPFEYFAYGFTASKPTPFASRAPLLDAIRGNPANVRYDNTPVPAGDWSRWLPDPLPATPPVDGFTFVQRNLDFPVPFGASVISLPVVLERTQPSFPIGGISGISDPGSMEARKQKVRDAILADPAFSDPAFPLWASFGYPSLDAFMLAWDWKFTYEPAGPRLRIDATKHDYTLKVPLVNPATGMVLVNRYADGPSGTLEQLDVTDTRLFGRSE